MNQRESRPRSIVYPLRRTTYAFDPFLYQYTLWQEKHDAIYIDAFEKSVGAKHHLMNEAIMAFAAPHISGCNGKSPLIVDGFAGLEGSLSAARQREYRWVGFNITHGFTRHLNGRLDHTREEVAITADFTDSPIKSASVDATFMIFGLNHMSDPTRGIQEAARITKHDGTVVIAESGIVYDTTLAIVHQLAPYLFENQPGAQKRIQELYKHLPSNDPYEFYEEMLYRQTGMSMNDAVKELRSILKADSELLETMIDFRTSVLMRYFLKIKNVIKQEGLEVVKAGLLVCGQNDEGDWELTNPLIDLYPSQWHIQTMQMKRWEGPLIGDRRIPYFMRRDPSYEKTIAPVIVLKKTTG